MSAKSPDIAVHPLVIIGSGFASLCLVAHLLETHAVKATDIAIIGPHPFGYGAAYGAMHGDYRLNVRAQIMRIFSGQPDDFLNWAATELEDNEAHNPQGAFYRRSDFARYLSYLKKRIKGFDALNFMEMQVASLAPDKQRWRLHLANGGSLMADHLVLATGNPPPRWPCDVSTSVSAERAVENPWSGKWLENIKTSDEIVFIGGGLTAMDGLYSLANRGHEGSIKVVMPFAVLPPKQTDWKIESPVKWPDNIASASQFSKFFSNTLGSRNWTEPAWQSCFEALRIDLNAVWQGLDDTEKKRLLRYMGRWWQLARFRSAPQNFESAQAMINKGQLHLIKGRVSGLKAQKAKLLAQLQDGSTLTADKIVNCTGPAGCPLILTLLKAGIIAPDFSQRGARIASDFKVLDGQKKPYDNLYGVGAMTASSLGDVIGAGTIAKQAESLAASLAPLFR